MNKTLTVGIFRINMERCGSFFIVSITPGQMKFENRIKIEALSIVLTRKFIEDNNMPKFHAIEQSQKIKAELANLKQRELDRSFKENGTPSNLLLWENWEYEPLKECVCMPGSKCDSIGECGK